jgi:hypothetical protein
MRLTTPVRLSPAVVLLFAATTLTSSAAVAAPIDDAKKAFAEGKAAFERGDYESALSSYQRANMILPAPNLYYNIGATYERLGRYQEAALAFDKYFEMTGTPTTDDERAFQDKLRTRADADRRRPNLPPPRAVTPPPAPPPQQPPVVQQPQQPPLGYYPQGYYAPPPGPSRELRLRQAKARRTRAIVLMSIGLPLTVAGIGVVGWAASDPNVTTEATGIFLGGSAFIVGVTLWAPGAASFVRSNRDVATLSKPDPLAGQPQPLPPSARGF